MTTNYTEELNLNTDKTLFDIIFDKLFDIFFNYSFYNYMFYKIWYFFIFIVTNC